MNKYMKKNKCRVEGCEKWIQAKGFCCSHYDKNIISDYRTQYRLTHKEHYKTYHRIRDREHKIKCINHYSNSSMKCACCGESNINFLTIEHINNNGAEHRRQINHNLYHWLIKNNFPYGFSVLCWNCNSSKGKFSICGHFVGWNGENYVDVRNGDILITGNYINGSVPKKKL